MLYLFFNLQAYGFGDQSSGATRKVVRVGTIYGVVGGVFGCNSGNTFINSKREDINCNVILSIQSMDKQPRMNVLQTPGF